MRTVDVWVRRVADVPDGRQLLDDHERVTLARLERAPAAEGYAAAHALARRAVAGVVGSPADRLRFDRRCDTCGEQHGKPTLPDFPAVHLSLSHANGFVAVALTSALPVGVDVESARATAFPGFAEVALHQDERLAVDRTAPGVVTWVRKEAALKALGIGLRANPAELLTPPSGIPLDLLGDGSWVTVRDVPLPWAEVLAAVAVAGRVGGFETRMR